MSVTVHRSFEETFPLRKTEWLLATLMTAMGLMAFFYPTMFAKSSSLISLLEYGSQATWATGMTIVGVVGWIALFRNGGWTRSPTIRAICATLRGLVWLQMLIALASLDNPSWGLVLFPAFVATEFLNAWQATQDRARSHKVVA